MILRFLFLLTFFALFSYAININEANVYERTNRIDVMLSFDAPFDGIISQKKEDTFLVVQLKDVAIKEKMEKQLSSIGITSIKIFTEASDSYIFIQKSSNIAITASKSAAGYGLRLRITQIAADDTKNTDVTAQNTATPATETPKQKNTELKDLLKSDEIDYQAYLTVLAILAVLLIVLLIVKRKVVKPAPKSAKGSWLFQKGEIEVDGVKIISQKNIDVKNRAVVFEADGIRYFVIIGANGISVLDKRPKDYKGNSNRFDTYLNENRERLDNYMGELGRLENYKQKASGNY